MESAFCQMRGTVCGKFAPDKGIVTGCENRIYDKDPAKWGVQIAGMIFQTRSSTLFRISAKGSIAFFTSCTVLV